MQLLRVSSQCDEKVAVSRRRQGRRRGNEVERRVARAETLIHLGELSSARQALEGSELAPGTMETLDVLRDPRRRPRTDNKGSDSTSPVCAVNPVRLRVRGACFARVDGAEPPHNSHVN